MINLCESSINLLKRCLENNDSQLLWVINDKKLIEVDEFVGNYFSSQYSKFKL